MKKIVSIITALLLLGCFAASASASTVSSFSNGDSVFELFDAHLTQKYVVDSKPYGYFVSESYSHSGVIPLNRELYDSLSEGDQLIIQHFKSTNAYSLLKKHQTDTYLVDVKKNDNTYAAVVMDGGEKKTVKIRGNSIGNFVIGQDVTLKGSGSALRIHTEDYQNKWDMISWFLLLTVFSVLFGKSLFVFLRKSFHAQVNKKT